MSFRNPVSDDLVLEQRIRQLASGFSYPPTPDLVEALRRRVPARRQARDRAAWSWAIGLAVLVLAAVLLLVEPVRARIVEWLRIGAVRIQLNEPSPTAGVTALSPTGTPEPAQTPIPTQTPVSLLDLAGETTLAEAEQQAVFALMAPPGAGEPDHVYYQQPEGSAVVVMVWNETGWGPLALYQIKSDGLVFEKKHLRDLHETTVKGLWAVWVEGPYELRTRGGELAARRIVEGRTLIWYDGGVTYRLESNLSLAEARRLAESLQPLEP